MKQANLIELMRDRAKTRGSRPALRFLPSTHEPAQSIDYATLDERVRALAATLQEAGLGGERVLLLYPPGLDYVVAYFGCLYAAVIAVPCYPPGLTRASTAILPRIVMDCGIRNILTIATWAADIDRGGWFASAGVDLSVLTTNTIDPTVAASWRPPEITDESLAFLQYTSGSTGDPKGVVVTHGNINANMRMIEGVFGAGPNDHACFWLPPYHDMGLIGGILAAIYCDTPTTLMPPSTFMRSPFAWLRAISDARATITGAPNFAFDRCIREAVAKPELGEGLDLSCLELTFSGAEMVRADTMNRFCEVFAKYGFRRDSIMPCYGMAETTLLCTARRRMTGFAVKQIDRGLLERARRAVDASEAARGWSVVGCGAVAPGVEVRIVNEDTRQECAAGEIGEVWVRGPSVAKGYWGKPEVNEAVFGARIAGSDDLSPTYLRTGDRAFFAEGELYIAGRLKDVVIVAGRNYAAEDIESSVMSVHPAIRPHRCVAFSIDQGDREKLVVLLELDQKVMPAGDTVEQLLGRVHRRVLQDHGLEVHDVSAVRSGNLPVTTSGKLKRRESESRYTAAEFDVIARHAPATAPPAVAEGTYLAAVEQAVRRHATCEVTPETRLGDLGLDSLKACEVSAALGDRFGIEIGPTVLTAESTIDKVAQEIGTLVKARGAVVQAGEPNLRFAAAPSNGQTHLHANGHSNGHAHATSHANGEAHGHSNGHANGHSNGHSNGHVDGHANGHSNGHARGVTNGDATRAFPAAGRPLSERLQAHGEQFERLKSAGLLNYNLVQERKLGATDARVRDETLTYFSSYSYLALNGHPKVIEAKIEAVRRFGSGAHGVALLGGYTAEHEALERRLARNFVTDDAVLYSSGFLANLAVIDALMKRDGTIYCDMLVHTSILDGCRLSGAEIRMFPHQDADALGRMLARRPNGRPALVIVDGVYSLRGEIANLPAIVEAAHANDALVMVDEAHALGAIGAHGRGTAEHHAVEGRVDIFTGGLGKGIPAYGGYVAGRREIVHYLRFRSNPHVYSGAMDPSNVAAALAGLGVMESDPHVMHNLRENIALMEGLLEAHRTPSLRWGSPCMPVVCKDDAEAYALSREMRRRGFYIAPIVYPAVPKDQQGLRLTVTAGHTQDQIRSVVAELDDALRQIWTPVNRPNNRAISGLSARGLELTMTHKSTTGSPYVTIPEALAAFARGEMLIVSDDEDRENEGDFVISAEHATPEAINFMISHGKGLVCLAISPEIAAQKQLPPMVARNRDPKGTAFTASVDASKDHGISTGISAAERSKTVQIIIDEQFGADDLRAPGHMFPLVARGGGLRERRGHTEAGVELARLAGCDKAAAVIVEVIKEDGEMARRDDLVQMSRKFRIPYITIDQLAKYIAENDPDSVPVEEPAVAIAASRVA